jgi:hypothetical protein
VSGMEELLAGLGSLLREEQARVNSDVAELRRSAAPAAAQSGLACAWARGWVEDASARTPGGVGVVLHKGIWQPLMYEDMDVQCRPVLR